MFSHCVAMAQLISSNRRNIPTICFIHEAPTFFSIPLFWRTYFNSVWTQIFQIVGIFLHFERMHILNEWEIWPNNNNHCVAVTLLISSNRRNIPTIWTIHEAPTTLKWSVIPTFRTCLNLNSILTQIFQIVGIFLMHKRSELITTVTVLLWLSWYPQIVGIFLQFEPFMKPRLLSQGTAIPLFWKTYFNSVWTQVFQIVGIFLHFQRRQIFNEWEIWPNHNNHCIAVTLLISSNRRNIPTIWTIHEAPTTFKMISYSYI